ncbi:cation:proton antiporter [Streptomyces sp. NBC_00893]|uniref:cation:proton antiporter n=1 Tax=Streptomyces sp. NBC_00893 TaxID=2975862 RepID=UPI002258075E|nr:cation:proton antiporter [Streptomyces sp. NBC_00893]MCX4849538.1 cation:proton antiporter [Streptomyces sp. NBC_00893]
MTSHQVQLLLADVALILFLARMLGALAARLSQPPVVGEILAGILLGPTLFDGVLAETLFPPEVRPLLTALANIGVALFMFAVGLEIDHGTLRGRGRLTAGAAIGSTLVPFGVGLALAYYLMRVHDTDQPVAFTVFIALAVSVTAFPVLARILDDRKLSRTALGGLALAVAAVVDIVAWAALAAVQASVGGAGGHWRVALVLPYIAVMLTVVRPLLRRFLARDGKGAALTPGRFSVVLIGALCSGAATEAMGMHYIFGAFLFGIVMPREGALELRESINGRVQHITMLLLPVYFVVAGLKVDLGGVGASELTQFAAIMLVAVAGKFGGTYLGARLQGLPARPSVALAALMNTRGLTELIILGVGLEAGLLDESLYGLMVAMALVTTAMTGPLLTLVSRRRGRVPRGGADGDLEDLIPAAVRDPSDADDGKDSRGESHAVGRT